MSKLVILEIRDANSEQRYPVTLRIGDSIHSATSGRLPPAKDVLKACEDLRCERAARGFGAFRKLKHIKKGQITQTSVRELEIQVKDGINTWLNSGDADFQAVRDNLLQVLSAEQGNIRLMVQTDDVYFWGFPWHLWDLLDRFKIEPVFSNLTHTNCNYPRASSKNKVRILVILGEHTDINVEADLKILKELIEPYAEITPLIAIRRSQLNDKLWERNWDILFFAGHSSSTSDYSQGEIALNDSESITIEDLKYGLENAIERGLKLAIFNSCDGMGLVQELASLQIPVVIAMRERVPDEVAQKFLEYFLETFAIEKKSLRDSVRKARERLHGMEGDYPCASWLPMIYENPAVEPPTWIELLEGNEEERKRAGFWRSLQAVLAASTIATGAVMGVRSLGFLEPLETKAFDRLAQIMPDKGLDSRLLIVEVTADDFKQLNNEYPLQDKTIVRALEKLNKHQPRTIGLEIYRDIPQGQGRTDLIKHLQQQERVIPICVFPWDNNPEGVAPPPGLPDGRPGFGDIVEDADRTLRRHLLAMKPFPSSQCKTPYSLSFQLALHYLQNNPNSTLNQTSRLPVEFKESYWTIGGVQFKKLDKHQGFYQKEELGGFQIILNYRSRQSLTDIAERVTLMQILNDRVDPSYIRDKIILIGVTDPTTGSANYNTPYNQEIPSLMFLAQRVSQIITAVEDRIPLMWFLPQWGDTLLILLWSVAGGFCAIRLQSRLHLGLAQAALLGILYGSCGFCLLTVGCVLPLVPSGFALLAASGCLIVYNASSKDT